MILFDVNVAIYAFREDSAHHEAMRAWLQELLTSASAYGYSDHVLSSFVRIVTNPRAFADPAPIDKALAFADAVRDRPQAVRTMPRTRHWEIFSDLCERSGARGDLVADAYFAALAIESGSEWVTTDRDYARFPGLRWKHPLE